MSLTHYQNAYVTRSMEKALPRFCNHFGISQKDVMQYEGRIPIRTPQGEGEAHQRIALVWIQGIQYELIEPIGGMVDLYTRELPDHEGLKFHHIAVRTEDWDATRDLIVQKGGVIAQEGESGGQLKFLYIDNRNTLGHHTEIVWATPERWAQMGWPR